MTEFMALSHTPVWIRVKVRVRRSVYILIKSHFSLESGLDIEGEMGGEQLKHLHSHTLIWAVISKGSPLFLEYDEVPNSQECIFRNMEME